MLSQAAGQQSLQNKEQQTTGLHHVSGKYTIRNSGVTGFVCAGGKYKKFPTNSTKKD